MTHTPGPWKLLPSCGVYTLDENNEVNRFSARIDGGHTIYTRRCDNINATSAEELAANARLIAAAPDYAAAAPDAADILEQYADFIRRDVKADDLERHPYLPLIEQTAADLRAAIARAGAA